MVKVCFIAADGERIESEVSVGTRLLEAAQALGLPLEGTCEGQMACSTCHVVLSTEGFNLVPPAVADEEDMLDLAAGVTRTSRLSCQIVVTEAMEGIEVHIPGESRNMQGR